MFASEAAQTVDEFLIEAIVISLKKDKVYVHNADKLVADVKATQHAEHTEAVIDSAECFYLGTLNIADCDCRQSKLGQYPGLSRLDVGDQQGKEFGKVLMQLVLGGF